MSPTRGYYCLIQFCPDPSRLEAANIGVLLFCPDRDFLRTRTSSDDSRVRRFFGPTAYDQKRLNAFKSGLEDRLAKEGLRSLADLEGFIARSANAIRLTPPRPIKVRSPEEELERLYLELVRGRPRDKAHGDLKAFLGKKFTEAGLAGRMRRDLTIRVPISEQRLKVPYGYQNGRFNLIRPVRFHPDRSEAVDTASRFAVAGESIHDTPDPTLGAMRLIVVGDFGGRKAENLPVVEHILSSYHVDLYELERVDALVQEIRASAKPLPADAERS